MFSNGSSYSLSDIAAVTGRSGSDGFGDGESWWVVLLFLLALGGWGNGGFGGNGGRESVAYSFDMNGLENGVRGIQQGLCDGFYAMNTGMLNGFSGVQSTLCQGFSGVTAGINSSANDVLGAINCSTNAVTSGLNGLSSQLASCCCDLRYDSAKNFSDLNYRLATESCDTRRAISDSTREIIDFLTKDKIAELTAENQSLKLAASQSIQNNYLISQLKEPCPIPAYVVANPNCCYGGYGYRGFGACCEG